MKKAYKFILMFLPIFSLCQNKNDSKNIEYIIQIFKNNNIDKISEIIDYPLKREYPIPVVKNKNDFKTRFNTIFDKNLIHIISNSKVTDWNEVGWRGIMLDNGIIWIDTDGKIIAINYQSDSEKKLLEDLIKNEKQELYIAIRNFAKPVYKIQTKSYLIRIDELKNGSYRYVSWKRGSLESSKPDLILENGELDFENFV